MRYRMLTVLVVCAALAASATSSSKATTNGPADMLVQTSWLAAHLADKNLVILHVGTDRNSYDAAHIPGARFLALSEIAVTRNGIPNELPPVNDLKATFERLGVGDHSRVVLYGDMLGLFAARAYFTLDYLGHGSSTALLDGGLEKWAREFGAVRTIPANVAAAKLTVHPHPELVMELPALRPIVSNHTGCTDRCPPTRRLFRCSLWQWHSARWTHPRGQKRVLGGKPGQPGESRL